MKRRIYVSLKQKEVSLILTALMYYEGWNNWLNDEPDEDIQKLKEKLNTKLKNTIKIKKRKEDNWPL